MSVFTKALFLHNPANLIYCQFPRVVHRHLCHSPLQRALFYFKLHCWASDACYACQSIGQSIGLRNSNTIYNRILHVGIFFLFSASFNRSIEESIRLCCLLIPNNEGIRTGIICHGTPVQ
jgi:hypothetical protein